MFIRSQKRSTNSRKSRACYLPLPPTCALLALLLFPVSLCDLPHEHRKRHGKRSVDRTGIGPAVVFEDFDGEGGIVGKDDSGLLHPHEPGLTLGLAERAAG